jgi:hypothetical protein
VYGPEVIAALRKMWAVLDAPAGKRLTPSKTRHGSKLIKKHDTAKTPFQRASPSATPSPPKFNRGSRRVPVDKPAPVDNPADVDLRGPELSDLAGTLDSGGPEAALGAGAAAARDVRWVAPDSILTARYTCG